MADSLDVLTAEIEAQIASIRRTDDVDEQRARVRMIWMITGTYVAHQKESND